VESIPVAETRSYVKRLMLYHWLYRRRFGQDARSLDQISTGQWPTYRPGQTVQSAGAGGGSAYGLKFNAKP
jgi:soluble lytic murein transglycosylase